MAITLSFVCKFGLLVLVHGQNLLKNPGFEDTDFHRTWGYGYGCRMEKARSPHTGTYSLKVTNRRRSWQGPAQYVNLVADQRYSVECYIKILNSNSKLYQSAVLTAHYSFNDGVHGNQYINYAEQNFLKPTDGWVKLAGDFNTVSIPWAYVRLFVQDLDPGIDYLLDDCSLKEIPIDVNWKTKADQGIDELRKTNVTVRVDVDQRFDPQHIDLQITHKKHLFAFGSMVEDPTFIYRSDYTHYQRLFTQFFNWATVGDYKWRYNGGTPHNPNYDPAIQATDTLRKMGIPVRGHCMFWGTMANVPDWVKHLEAFYLKSAINERVKYMVNMTRGKLEHWDVVNELLHGHLFEEVTKDPLYSQKLYKIVHDMDPSVKLFLNDDNVLSEGALTESYVTLATAFRDANIGLYGLGLQSHFPDNTAPDPTLLKARLDRLATTGLPLWISGLVLSDSSPEVRADWLEAALTTYFSHPAVEGVIVWGFWDHVVDPNEAMVNGNSYTINPMGKRWLDLIKNRWSTNITRTLSTRADTFSFRGFQGDYDVVVRYNGKPIKFTQFSVPKNSTFVNLHVDGDGHEIQLTTPALLGANSHNTHNRTVNINKQTVASATSTSIQNQMACQTKISRYSRVGDDQYIDVGCDVDEVMTACMSRTRDQSSTRDGETILDYGGLVCRAINAFRSHQGVQAVARCCKRTGLECDYVKAGPSGDHVDDQIQVDCPAGRLVTGCSSTNQYGAMDGVFPVNNSCVAQHDGKGGVYVYAACCSSPDMVCTVRSGSPSAERQGDVSSVACQFGESMMGCSVYSEDGDTAGVQISDHGSVSP